MRILGLDPGTRVVGYGIVDSEGSHLAFVDAGVISLPGSMPLETRLGMIAGRLRDLVGSQEPDVAAVEEAFVKLDPRAALTIGHARGAILAVLGEAGVPVHGYPPATIKKAVTGNGNASKEQVARMVSAILGRDLPAMRADATDALAASLAHALGHRAQLLSDQ